MAVVSSYGPTEGHSVLLKSRAAGSTLRKGFRQQLMPTASCTTPASSNKKGRGGDSVIGVKSCMSSVCLIDLSTSFNLTCHRYSSLEPCPFVLSLFLLCLFLTMSCTFLFS